LKRLKMKISTNFFVICALILCFMFCCINELNANQNKYDYYALPKGAPSIAGPIEGDLLTDYLERGVLTLTNLARMSPKGVKQIFTNINSGITLSSAGIHPLYHYFELDVGARYHSHHMDSNCFQHDSCDGSNDNFGERLRKFYSRTDAIGENIAWGQTSPQQVVVAWINSEGHRKNIMNSNYRLLGVGHDYNPRMWTQKFSSGASDVNTPIVSVSHYRGLPNTQSGELKFLTNYYNQEEIDNNLSPQSARINIDGTWYDLQLENNL
jgi:hypothetical protein